MANRSRRKLRRGPTMLEEASFL